MINIIIVNYNGLQYLDHCLSSLIQQNYRDFDVTIVDNASQDGSVAYIQEKFPWVRVVQSQENQGYGAAVNKGILKSSGEYILTLNNDTEVHPDFLRELLIAIESSPYNGMAAPKMLFPDGRINSTGLAISRSGAVWDRGIFEEDKGQYDTCTSILGPCGGAALYRRTMLESIGLFEEDYFLYYEDADIALRACNGGWKCVFAPHARVMHLHGATAGFQSDLYVYYISRNILWNVVKNYPLKELVLSLPFIIGRSLVAIPYYSLRGQGKVVLKAKLDAVRRMGEWWRKRGKAERRQNTRFLLH